MKRSELVAYLDNYLRIDEISDYGPQGLQIEGTDEVNRIIGLVDAHQPCVERAIQEKADLMLVHHGVFWGPAQKIAGHFAKLIRTFIHADLNLYAAHLPLDAHPEIGNNAVLAQRLGLNIVDWWANIKGTPLAALADAPPNTTFDMLIERFTRTIGPISVVQQHGPLQVERVGILSGGGAGNVHEAAALGCDTYITGETSHAHYYDALNANINVIYAGHYTSETVGVQALGEHLAREFNLEFAFIDLPTHM